MITDNEKFIEIQGILSHSDISSNECIKINNLIIELSNENQELKEKIKSIDNLCKKQKEAIDKIFSRITLWKMEDITMETTKVLDDLLSMMKKEKIK